MKNKLFKVFFYILLITITIGYLYFIRPLMDDELFNYGFSYNILNGILPYRDFNMVVTPLFSYILAILLAIIGRYLIVYHLLIAIIIASIFHISYKLIGKYAIAIYLLLLVFPYIGYNMFSLLLLFCLYYYLNKQNNSIIEPIIISLMILTKQTLILLAIPSLIMSKNRKKTFSIYLLFAFLFLLYLVFTGSFYNFFDYCLFGLFDFASNNATGFNFLMIVEIIIIIVLTYFSFKTKDKNIIFTLMFQIITLPIIDYYHFITSFIPVVYLIFKHFKNKSFFYMFSMVITISFFLMFNYLGFIQNDVYKNLNYYNKNSFMKYKMVSGNLNSVMDNISKIIVEHNDYDLYYFGIYAYCVKLNLDIPINKFDNINNGNMGYKGSKKYIEEVENNCKNNKCLIFISEYNSNTNESIQINKEILEYVKNNYYWSYGSSIYTVYVNSIV